MNQKMVWGWVALIAVVMLFGLAYFDLQGNIAELESTVAEIENQLVETSDLAEIRQAQMNREIGSSNSRIDTLDAMIDIIAKYHEEVPHRE